MKILLAMSGGVDSTAAALLLREQGYDLVGCTFRTRYTTEQSLQAAVNLAKQLGVEHHIVDYSDRFDDTVIRYFRDEYLAGRTPNPCVLCNKTIKFGALLDEADRLGCEYIATGHYARVQNGYLYRAADTHKDQTYFLWQLSQEQLNRVIFPLGDMTKQQVREYLAVKGFTALSQSGESQDICFIQDDYRTFLNLPPNPGKYVLSPSLRSSIHQSINSHASGASIAALAAHQGFAHYTIGQRKGLGVALGEPAFVTRIDAATNTVTLGTHDELYTHEVHLRDVVFSGDSTRPVMAQIRYRSIPQEARLQVDGGQCTMHAQRSTLNAKLYTLHSKLPVWAPTPGQSCVFYQDNRLVGGGIITFA